VTGFRFSPGGAQAEYGITPDLTTLAKTWLGASRAAPSPAARRSWICWIASSPNHRTARRSPTPDLQHPDPASHHVSSDGHGRDFLDGLAEARRALPRYATIPPRWLPARCRHARARLARATGLLPLRQPAGRYGGERDRPAVAPPHTVARTRAETPDAHCAFGEAIARYRASNAANEQHHHGPDDHYKRSGASPGPKAGGPVFRVM
jgi:hypothetical protein